MQLILGLGNLGKKYESTRHNIGFRVLDQLAATNNLPTFKPEAKFKAEIAASEIAGKKVILAKPQTFMNLSGEAARAIINFYKLTPADIFVIQDDKDLPFREIRIRGEGGHGGHNGIRSLIQHLGTEEFSRLKIGVANELLEKMETDDFVLGNFSKEEETKLPEIISRAVDATTEFLENGLESTMNRFNS